jgi:dUTP pyrophosphatase
MDLIFSRTSPFGEVLPSPYRGDAGLDMVVAEQTVLAPLKREVTRIRCGVQIALPDGVAAMVMARSSAVLRGILVVSTLIDPGYRGEMYVFAYNMTDTAITLQPGQRIAQLVPFATITLKPVHFRAAGLEDLPKSARGEKGFGSSG